MTFGDLDAVDIADYRRRSESEAVGVDFPDSADLKRVFANVEAEKNADVDGCSTHVVVVDVEKDDAMEEERWSKPQVGEESVIFLEERGAVLKRECTLFKKDSGKIFRCVLARFCKSL